MPLLILLILPFLGSLLAVLLPINARNREAWLAGLISLGGTLLAASLYPQVADGGVMRFELAWMPQLGLSFVLRLDGYAWLFAMLILGIGFLVVLYARYYMSPEDPVPRFFCFFLAFMGSMLGLVLSGNLIQIVLFWELTSLASFLLIGYWHHRSDARRGARMALTVTATGGLCLFVGVLMLGRIVGSYDLDDVLRAGDVVREHGWYRPILVLIVLGALTKSAQFPFHFWLPRAMAAPTPVSAYLHSATMVKAGVFLLTRLWPVLAGTPEWNMIIGGAGVCTLLIGAFLAIFQQDLKGLLAYSTISHLGLITLLLGIGSPLAAVAAIFHTINHATFKASLFMAAGIIDHETGTRDIRRLSGLIHSMPITGTLALVASAAMAGVPLLNGFISKEMFFAETIMEGGTASDYALPVAATIAGMFSVTYSLRFIHDVFFGPPAQSLPREPHEPPHWMRFPVELLVLACLVVGVLPALTVGPLLHSAANAVLGDDMPVYSLAVWHGWNTPLLMSLAALGGGALLYLLLQRHLKLGTVERLPIVHHFDGKRAFDWVLTSIGAVAARLEAVFSTRRLQPQLTLVFVLTIAAAGIPLYRRGLAWGEVAHTPVDPVFAMLWAIGVACAAGAAYQAKYHRLMALALMGGAGLVTCLTFIWFSAPDLALTQLMVETVTMVLLLLGLRWLPRRLEPKELDWHASLRDWGRRGRDLLIAVGSGAGAAVLAYAVLTRPQLTDGIASFFMTRALPEGGGGNVVNVILVDFRGFDTMGEITVLGIVALTVYALLRRFRPAPESAGIPAQQTDAPTPPGADADSGYLMVPGVFLRLLLPIMLMVAIFFFMRGHNVPGGGFVAGLIAAVALILQYMTGGTVWVEAHSRLHPHRWVATGLLTAVFTGMGAWVFGYPFLTSHSPHPRLPWIGEVPLPSAFLFDLGVFTLVVGATLLVLVALAHQSVRSHRMPQAASAPTPTPAAVGVVRPEES
ncbi:MAG: monovalent cation/H+ antiporter subunit A [Burkholderiaceae bacterium]